MSIRLLSDNAVLPALHARGRGALPLSSLSQVSKQMLVCTLYNTLYSVHYSVYSYLPFLSCKMYFNTFDRIRVKSNSLWWINSKISTWWASIKKLLFFTANKNVNPNFFRVVFCSPECQKNAWGKKYTYC